MAEFNVTKASLAYEIECKLQFQAFIRSLTSPNKDKIVHKMKHSMYKITLKNLPRTFEIFEFLLENTGACTLC